MEVVSTLPIAILPSMLPTLSAYAKLHESNRTAIESTPKTTFKYGPHFRHVLDIYTPSAPTSSPTPILLYLYGGGLERGDRIMPSPPCAEGLVYANVGHYFASRGYLTIIPDYRRIKPSNVEDCHFPSGGEDLALVLKWLQRNIDVPHPRELFLTGHSAGAIHIATWLLHPSFADSRASVAIPSNDNRSSTSHIKLVLWGIGLISMPAHFRDHDASRGPIIKAYYGERVEEDSPLGLLESHNEALREGVGILVVNGSREPDEEINLPSREWVQAAREKRGKERVEVEVVEGCNHFSHIMGLGTGVEGEEGLGRVVMGWIARMRERESGGEGG